MCVSYNDQYLIVGTEFGSVFIFYVEECNNTLTKTTLSIENAMEFIVDVSKDDKYLFCRYNFYIIN